MIQKVLVPIFIISLFLLTSCGSSKSTTDKTDHSKVDRAYSDFNQKNNN